MKKMKKAAALAAAAAMAVSGMAAAAETEGETGDMAIAAAESAADAMTEAEVSGDYDFTVDLDSVTVGGIEDSASVHDPSIIKGDDGRYYIFGTHVTAAVSDDLRTWEYIAQGYRKSNPLFTEEMWDKDGEAFSYSGAKSSLNPTDDGTRHVWAPDVIYNETMGKYMMYLCFTSNWNTSNLCFATSDTIEGPYIWQDKLIYSGFTSETIDATDVCDYVDKETALSRYVTSNDEYNYNNYPNALDPSVFFDEDGRFWMVYGSWSGGIYLLELDPETGYVIHPEEDRANGVDPYFGKKLLGGGHNSIEGPYIQYDPDSGYYYLEVSYGSLSREGGYQIRIFRSETVDGDYLDMNGKHPTNASSDHSKFGLKLSGNYMLPSLPMAYMATGHNSSFIDEDGKKYICYHTRFDNKTEDYQDRVKQVFLNEEAWPCILPYATDSETISETGYDISQTAGRYYVVNSGTDISASINDPVIWYLNEDGTVAGDGVQGTWNAKEGTYCMSVTVDDVTYSGVFCEQKDEAGTDVMVFSAVGSNRTLWGVKY